MNREVIENIKSLSNTLNKSKIDNKKIRRMLMHAKDYYEFQDVLVLINDEYSKLNGTGFICIDQFNTLLDEKEYKKFKQLMLEELDHEIYKIVLEDERTKVAKIGKQYKFISKNDNNVVLVIDSNKEINLKEIKEQLNNISEGCIIL